VAGRSPAKVAELAQAHRLVYFEATPAVRQAARLSELLAWPAKWRGVRALLKRLVRFLPEGPDDQLRASQQATIVAHLLRRGAEFGWQLGALQHCASIHTEVAQRRSDRQTDGATLPADCHARATHVPLKLAITRMVLAKISRSRYMERCLT
jgi:hypothetical protein